MVVGAEQRVKWARQDVVTRGRLKTEGAGLVPGGGGGQGKAKASGSQVVAPREEAMTDGGGVFGERGVALWQRGPGGGVVSDEKGPAGIGEGAVDLEAGMGEADPGLLYGGQPSHCGQAVFRTEPRGSVHMVQQNVERGSSDVGVEVARGWLTNN